MGLGNPRMSGGPWCQVGLINLDHPSRKQRIESLLIIIQLQQFFLCFFLMKHFLSTAQIGGHLGAVAVLSGNNHTHKAHIPTCAGYILPKLKPFRTPTAPPRTLLPLPHRLLFGTAVVKEIEDQQ